MLEVKKYLEHLLDEIDHQVPYEELSTPYGFQVP